MHLDFQNLKFRLSLIESSTFKVLSDKQGTVTKTVFLVNFKRGVV